MTEDGRRPAWVAVGALVAAVVLLALALASDAQWAVVVVLVVVTPAAIALVIRWIGRF